MIIRKIKPEELKRTYEMFAIAFEFADKNEKSAEEVFKEVIENPKSREDRYWAERWAAFEDDDSTMMSSFIAQPFPVSFDGNIYRMTGIGGVASLPQFRGNGCIRRCFEAALSAMYEDGVAFSYLYPFSTAFYRKFGYEMACENHRYHVRLNSYRAFNIGGKSALSEPGRLMADQIKTIYYQAQKKYNMMIANEDYEFAWIEKEKPVKDQVFTYVYTSGDGTPKAYMSVKQVNEDDGRNLMCTRFIFVDSEGLKGLLNILRALGSDHAYATFDVPSDIDLSILLPEQTAVSCKKYYLGMVRVINVEQVLRGARYQGTGKAYIQISDPQIQENTGIFAVEFKDGKALSVEKKSVCENGTVNIKMGINEFSRAVIGACDVAAFDYMDNVEICSDREILSRIFYKKPTYIAEYF